MIILLQASALHRTQFSQRREALASMYRALMRRRVVTCTTAILAYEHMNVVVTKELLLQPHTEMHT
jgi:hypothetical protein